MAQEGVLGRTSCPSWVPWACWGGPRAVESRTNPPAGWLAGCRGLPGGVLGVTGSWEGAAALVHVEGRPWGLLREKSKLAYSSS